ncbi:S-ribosylhomocysteine lyase [Spirochaeta lutea]|uniref:S-ribosylhomocysteine lyase n=1 Tax=Spirochaeta lutea TaxID=1480694 RepID=A0A098QV60_9SPIO|nr:S-ribosylhomocysteine lyase [Spirochaeta lutea]KGE71745.1 S-ribosylhomocysteinase [Spirochaeta lutea]
MNKIPSFEINHHTLQRGVFVSRIDTLGDQHVTTFDIRMKEPNREPVVDVPALHTIEHLGATFLRNHPDWSNQVIYFGPMGCRTGNYLLIKGNLTSRDILPLVREMFEFMGDFNEDVPGAAARDCGNYLSHDLPMAKWESKKFIQEVLRDPKPENLAYPQD